MLTVETPAGMKAHIGQKIGTSDWVLIDQAKINAFADATGDHQWIHVDTERAAREMPNGRTIAHGYLSLSLIPMFTYQLWSIGRTSQLINYGANKIRFTSMVPVGSRVRLTMTLKDAEDAKGGVRLFFDCAVEIEGSDKPAVVAEVIFMAFD